jgi:sporulation protein YtfJ
MNSEIKKDRINKVVETTLKNISDLIDVNTAIGAPIKTEDGKYILPVSKITIGVLVGGGEYGKINIFKSSKDLPYSAGNGAIITIKPCGFLVNENDNYKMISVLEKTHEKIFDKLTDFLSGISNEKNN